MCLLSVLVVPNDRTASPSISVYWVEHTGYDVPTERANYIVMCIWFEVIIIYLGEP